MHRAYVPPSFIDDFLANNRTPLPKDVEKRFCRILRVGPKEMVGVFDGEGRGITGNLLMQATGCVINGVVEVVKPRSQKLILLQAAIEEKKLSETLRHGTELGIDSFILFSAKRSEPFVYESLKKRVDRLQSIVIDACRQSGRVHCPGINFCDNISSFMNEPFLGFVCAVDTERMLLATLSSETEHVKTKQHIVIAIGPEGGLTQDEQKILTNNHFLKVSLGPFVLRTEFAGLAAAAVVTQWITE